jgi:hypothetical protein
VVAETGTLNGGTVLPDFTLPVTKIFAELELLTGTLHSAFRTGINAA